MIPISPAETIEAAADVDKMSLIWCQEKGFAIFDKDGLVYYSEHDSSLDDGPAPMGPYTPVQPVYGDEGNLLLTVQWK